MYRFLTLPSISSSVFLAIAHFFADWQGTCLLYSGGDLETAQSSLLGLFPFETVTVHGQQMCYQQGKRCQKWRVSNPWDGLQESFFDALNQDPDALTMGWLGYGMGAFAEPEIALPYRPASTPDAYWQRFAIVLERDHKTEQVVVTINLSALEYLQSKAKHWIQSLTTVEEWKEFLKKLSLPSKDTLNAVESSFALVDCPQRRAGYTDKIQQAQEWIRAGDIYQVNLSQVFDFQIKRHPFSLFKQVCKLNPAPFSAYLHAGQTSILSTSPERFLCKKGQILETRPIKGTIQRGKTEEEDQFLKQYLLGSPKERAELLMITDLMRNDLGKISQVGSVQVIDLWRCEAYTNVFHLLSIIRSIVKPDLKPLEIVRACFPGGSITGCPKIRAMEAIDQLENRPRGIYTGAIGYFNGKGDFDLNIAIRTLVIEKNVVSLQLGGGIVIDSNPQQEYEETLFKGASLFQILH